MIRKCLTCGKQIITRGAKKYCSQKCYWISLKEKIPWNKNKMGVTTSWNKGIKNGFVLNCVTCNKKFYVRKSRKNAKYCSLQCAFKSKEYVRKLGLPKKGKSLSSDHKISISLALKIKARRGKDHPFWKNGISDINKQIRTSLEYKMWREAVFKRDDYTCQMCSKKGGLLHPNHIKRFADYPYLRFDVKNGITLCEKCHVKKVNRHEEEWEKFFHDNLKNREFLFIY